MTELEKLQSGQVYNDFDEDLFQRRIAAKKLFRAYNRTEDEETALRRDLLERLLGRVGKTSGSSRTFAASSGKIS